MKVYINGKFLNQRITGVQRVAKQYTDLLLKTEHNIEIIENKYQGLMAVFFEQIILPWKTKDGILINFCNTGPLIKTNQILFIHDAAFMASKSHSKLFRYYYRVLITLLLHRAKKVITVSDFSKDEIVKYFNFNVSKLAVIKNGMDFEDHIEQDIPDVRNKLSNFKKIVLTVSSMDPRKNLKYIAESWIASNPSEDSVLVIVGGKNKVFADDSVSIEHDNILFTGYVTDEELIAYYRSAHFYVSASEYEGFGLPIAESINFGCIPLLSDIPVHRELFGTYGYFFENDSKQLREVFANLPEYTMKKSAITESETWKSSVNTLIQVLRETNEI
ncbi:glycosyltransferase family 4 protein [Alteromonas sp. RKMC-009]|uniref:glycosyltransferase family 4 protein n=1 Tax=Alteromonas sp. RKMC-009 TaxID=2267264 RepID=UPI000E6A82D8|nr:glycosyltransferase family 1 protein [Alteromonas sp. RKMC-009]AYA62827.1 glycosyltransferase family 1 protein [Alteromonas sp. RKMC-009]